MNLKATQALHRALGWALSALGYLSMTALAAAMGATIGAVVTAAMDGFVGPAHWGWPMTVGAVVGGGALWTFLLHEWLGDRLARARWAAEDLAVKQRLDATLAALKAQQDRARAQKERGANTWRS